MNKRGLNARRYALRIFSYFRGPNQYPGNRNWLIVQRFLFHIKTHAIWRLQFLFVILKSQIPKKYS